MISQDEENRTIEGIFLDELAHEFLATETHADKDASVLPVLPYIGSCYTWLLNNLHNPYPSRIIKERLLRAALGDAQRTKASGFLSPPPSPKRSITPLPSDTVTLDDIDNWFIAARARIGWSELRDAKFDGSRSLMLQAARLMWCSQEERDFMTGCVSQREANDRRVKTEEVMPHLRSPYESVSHDFVPVAPTTEPTFMQSGTALAPDVELAFTVLEETAKELYAHRMDPTELVGTLKSSATDRRQVDQPTLADVDQLGSTSFKAALAEAVAAKRRDARRDQRRVKKIKTEVQRRAAERRCYPSPEPSSAEDSQSSSEDDIDGSDAEESDVDEDGLPSELLSPFTSLFPPSTTTESLLTDDEGNDSEASDESESEDEEGEDETEDEFSDEDDSDDSDGDEEDWEPPAPLAGSKRQREDIADEVPAEKKQRTWVPYMQLPSPAPESRSCSPCSPVRPTREGSPPETTFIPAVHASWSARFGTHSTPKKKSSRRADVVRLTPPPAPVHLGADGVPLGTVRGRIQRPHHAGQSYVHLHLPFTQLSNPPKPRLQGLRVSGDPTPWVNWDLSGGQSNMHQARSSGTSGSMQDASESPTTSSPSPTTTLSRSSSTSSLSSQRSVSSASSDPNVSDMCSIFSTATDETCLTEPYENVRDCSTKVATEPIVDDVPAPVNSSAFDPSLFDPHVWSNYDLNACFDGHFQDQQCHSATTFVPNRLQVHAVTAKAVKHNGKPACSPTRLAHSLAAPVVSYQQAVGTLASPSRATFDRAQIAATLAKGTKAGEVLRNSSNPSKAQRRSTSPNTATEPVVLASPSDLVHSVLSSGLVPVAEGQPMESVEVSKKASNYLRRRTSKSAAQSVFDDSADAVHARLAEIEQQAVRLEEERKELKKLASSGRAGG